MGPGPLKLASAGFSWLSKGVQGGVKGGARECRGCQVLRAHWGPAESPGSSPKMTDLDQLRPIIPALH
ncbi:hypothetical protein BDF22DRAFT_741016 [Syncephalis plumigaleata]|nr:hypothetical protein BDF22DRAFT_741016 [Syncephalis plumigaleata]